MKRNFSGNVSTGGKTANFDKFQSDALLSDREMASLLNCGRSTVWRYVSNGTLPPPIKIGDLSRWRLSTYQALVADAEQKVRQD